MRQKLVETLEEKLEEIKTKRPKARQKAINELKAHRVSRLWQIYQRTEKRFCLFYGEFKLDAKIVKQLTELTHEQKNILKALKIKEPSTIVDIHDA